MPIGLDQGDEPLRPRVLAERASDAGLFGSAMLRALVTRSARPLVYQVLRYGHRLDPRQPMVEVTTHWDGERWNDTGVPGAAPGAWELGRAEHTDQAAGRRDLLGELRGWPRPPGHAG